MLVPLEERAGSRLGLCGCASWAAGRAGWGPCVGAGLSAGVGPGECPRVTLTTALGAAHLPEAALGSQGSPACRAARSVVSGTWW